MNGTEVARHALARLEVAVRKKFKGDVTSYKKGNGTDGNYEADLDLGAAAHVNISIRTEYNTAIMRSDSTPKGLSGPGLEDLGTEIMQRIPESRMTSYDDTLSIMKAVSFDGMEDTDAERLIFNEAMGFIQALSMYQGRLAGGDASAPLREGEFTEAGELDPYGFDSITEDEIMEAEADALGEDPMQAPEALEEDIRKDTEEDIGKAPEDAEDKVSAEQVLPDSHQEDGTVPQAVPNRTADEALLSELLDDFEKEEAQPAHADGQAAGAQELAENLFAAEEEYHGSDQFGLIGKTKEYRDAAEEAVNKIREILSSLYQPMYSLAGEIYSRNDQLALSERNIQLKLDALGSRQKELDDNEAEFLARQQSLLQERTRFNEYKESVRNIINDYDVKTKLAKELEDEIKLLKYDLSEQKKTVEAYKAQIEQMSSPEGEAAETAQAALLKQSNENLKAQVTEMSGRIENYLNIIKTFRRCQSDWDTKEKEYIRKLDEKTSKDKEALEAKKRADDASAEMDKLRRRAESLEADARRLEEGKREAENRAEEAKRSLSEMEQKLHEAEEQARKADAQVLEIEKELKEKDEKAKDPQAEMDIPGIANSIREDLAKIGVQASPVPGAAEMVLEADSQGCSIAVNVELFMLFVSKKIRKPSRYAHKVDELNKLDIRTTYMYGEQEMTCKSAYRDPGDVVMQIKDILDTMREFK